VNRVCGLAIAFSVLTTSPVCAQLTSLYLEDYATMPMTGSVSGASNAAYLARVNFLADESGANGASRHFVNDLNGQLYILDKSTKSFTEYLNLNGRDSNPGLFDRFYNAGGFAGGFVTFQFDPGYADPASIGYGKFYTIHVEQGSSGSETPSNANYPGLNTSNYGVTPSLDAPGAVNYRNVLVEWKDTDIGNTTFEGTARELLRIDARDRIHPIGDFVFNPTAGPEDPDWRMMYVSIGDAGNGEQSAADVRRTPQLLNALGGKILRILPDAPALHEDNTPTTASPNGKYMIPNDNPFTSVANSAVRDEVYALGFRNPHRMSWDVNPALTPNDTNYATLIVNDIGLHTWEEVNIVHAGGNYGYSQREGNEELDSDNSTSSLSSPDTIENHLVCTGGTGGFGNCTSNGTVTPLYPVIQYGHALPGQDNTIAGDSISSGYVYRGGLVPELYGKYVYGDITTGRIFYSDFDEMLTADDGDPSTLAEIHELNVVWDDPNTPAGETEYTTIEAPPETSDHTVQVRGPLFQIVDAAYHARGGTDPNLPGNAGVTAPYGRADIRIQVDENGELYILSKSDGMIRAVVSPSRLTLTVDRATGAATIDNAASGAIAFEEYSITSASGSLNGSDGAWNSLQDQAAVGWQEVLATAGHLSEANASGDLSIGAGDDQPLGSPYQPAYTEFGQAPPDDLAFTYELPNGQTVIGRVEYAGVARDNTLMLAVDPTTGRTRLTNTSQYDVTIDAYSIVSDSASLLPNDGDWKSFNDQSLGAWIEASPTAEQLSELSSEDVLVPAGGEIDMGWLFDPAGDEDLGFQFSTVGIPAGVLDGVVVYEAVGLAGDYNDDGTVDAVDYTVWRNAFGSTTDRRADGDGDHTVDDDDYAIWKQHYGETLDVGAGAGSGGLANLRVPEPASGWLAVFAFAAFVRRGRRGPGHDRSQRIDDVYRCETSGCLHFRLELVG
jgi:hypothetical protein